MWLFVIPWTVASQVLCPWNSSGKSTGVGCHFFFQGIFPTQGWNPGLLQCRQILYHLSYWWSPLYWKYIIIHMKYNLWKSLYCRVTALLIPNWSSQFLQMQSLCCCCWVASVVSDSVQHHRWQPTRLSHPWDSPGKNTGVGCHCLLQQSPCFVSKIL